MLDRLDDPQAVGGARTAIANHRRGTAGSRLDSLDRAAPQAGHESRCATDAEASRRDRSYRPPAALPHAATSPPSDRAYAQRSLTCRRWLVRLRVTRGERQPHAAREGRDRAPARVSFCARSADDRDWADQLEPAASAALQTSMREPMITVRS